MREASDCRTVIDTDSYAFFRTTPNANEGKTEATIIHMQRETRFYLDAKLLSNDKGAALRAEKLLDELKDKGFYKDGLVIFDSTQEEEVNEIFDRHMFLGNLPKNYNL